MPFGKYINPNNINNNYSYIKFYLQVVGKSWWRITSLSMPHVMKCECANSIPDHQDESATWQLPSICSVYAYKVYQFLSNRIIKYWSPTKTFVSLNNQTKHITTQNGNLGDHGQIMQVLYCIMPHKMWSNSNAFNLTSCSAAKSNPKSNCTITAY